MVVNFPAQKVTVNHRFRQQHHHSTQTMQRIFRVLAGLLLHAAVTCHEAQALLDPVEDQGLQHLCAASLAFP